MNRSEWMHDWNVEGPMAIPPGTRVLLNDETLRDGLQNPSIQDPTIEEKIELLHLMESLGIDSVNIGLPGAGPRAVEHVEALAREIATNRMRIRPNCAARTLEADIRPIAEISQRVGIAIEAATFLGSSPIRRLVEDWTVDHLERTTEAAVKFAVAAGAALDVRHRRYDPHGPRNGEAPLQHGDPQRCARDCAVRHGGARDAAGDFQPGEICDRERG